MHRRPVASSSDRTVNLIDPECDRSRDESCDLSEIWRTVAVDTEESEVGELCSSPAAGVQRWWVGLAEMAALPSAGQYVVARVLAVEGTWAQKVVFYQRGDLSAVARECVLRNVARARRSGFLPSMAYPIRVSWASRSTLSGRCRSSFSSARLTGNWMTMLRGLLPGFPPGGRSRSRAVGRPA